MLVKYNRYKTEVIDQAFVRTDGSTLAKTIRVHFYSDKESEVLSKDYGLLDSLEIYRAIKNNEALNLSQAYIKELNIKDLKEKNFIPAEQMIEIQSIDAQNSFFDAAAGIDLSFVSFGKGNINFSHSVFARSTVSFHSSHFENGNVMFDHTIFNCDVVDFSNTTFGEGEINFKSAYFHKGFKNFQYANFGKGSIIFINTQFNDGDVSFINSVIHEGDALFKMAHFGKGRKDFHYAKFGIGTVSFEKAYFHSGEVNFRNAEFDKGKVNFNRSQFGDCEILFDGCDLHAGGKFSFRKVKIHSGEFAFSLVNFKDNEVYFDETDFGNTKVTFYNSCFKKLSLKSCHLNNYVDLRVSSCEHLDLSDTIVRDIIDLKPFNSPVNINIMDITGIRLIGRIYIDWKLNNVKELIQRQEYNSFQHKAEQYRALKQNFNVTGLYYDEDKAYLEFKRMEAKAVLVINKQEGFLGKIWGYLKYVAKKLILDNMGLYATSPERVLISVVIAWFGFGILFFLTEMAHLGNTVSAVNNPDHLSILFQSFYHSAITFFTIGYGDVFPVGLSRLVSALEGFTGVFMMSYFTVAFVRKILR